MARFVQIEGSACPEAACVRKNFLELLARILNARSNVRSTDYATRRTAFVSAALVGKVMIALSLLAPTRAAHKVYAR